MQIPHPANFRFSDPILPKEVFRLQSQNLSFGKGKSLAIVGETREPLLEGDSAGWWGTSAESWMLRLKYSEDMKFFGLGQKTGSLEKTGLRTRFWNVDVWGEHPLEQVRTGAEDPQYISIPWLIIERQCGNKRIAIGLWVDHPGNVFFSLAPDMRLHECQDQVEGGSFYLGAPNGPAQVHLFYAETVEELAQIFSRFVGTMPCPPRWAFGNHQCRWGYRGTQDLQELDAGFRKHSIPCDGLWLDIDYMDGFRVFTTSPNHFSDPARVIADMREKGRRVVAILDPGVKDEPGFPVRDEGVDKDLFCHNPNGDYYRGYVWPGATLFPDFSLPEARDWWADKVAQFCDLGFAGFWLDMNDPSTGSVEQQSMLFGRGSLEHEAYHNLYANAMAQATWEGMWRARPEENPFLITRSASTGIARWSGVWMGDNFSNWHHLRRSIPMALNLSMSGVPFLGADIPGFGDDASAELMERWIQAHCLFPFFRNHSVKDSIRQEPWVFGEATTSIARKYIQLRYRMIPYLHSQFHEQERSGALVLRPYFMEDPSDDSHQVEDQFFVGRHLLVAPVMQENCMQRKVRIPAGTWINFWSRQEAAGPTIVLAETPRDFLPLYYRKGSHLPMLRTAPHISTDEVNWDDLEYLA